MVTRRKCPEFGYRFGIARVYKTRIGCTGKKLYQAIIAGHFRNILS